MSYKLHYLSITMKITHGWGGVTREPDEKVVDDTKHLQTLW